MARLCAVGGRVHIELPGAWAQARVDSMMNNAQMALRFALRQVVAQTMTRVILEFGDERRMPP